MRFFSLSKKKTLPEALVGPDPYGKTVILVGSNSTLMAIQKPWAHRLVLHGLDYSKSRRILELLYDQFEKGKTLKDASYQGSMDYLMRSAVSSVSGLTVQQSGYHFHELKTFDARSSAEFLPSVERMKLIARRGETLEIGYDRERVSIAGSEHDETHIHRIRVLEFHEKWFRAHDGVGLRNYSYAKVKWVRPLGFTNIQPPYFIDVCLNIDPDRITHKLGLFLSPEKGLVEDYTRLRTKGLYFRPLRGQSGPRIIPPLEEAEHAHD